MLRHRLGTVLQQQRQRFGLTQSELAERAGLSLKYLGEIERGEANVTVDALEKIALALDWDPWQLFNTDRTPISQNVHQLLVAEIQTVRQRLQSVVDWLHALDPHARPPEALGEEPGDGGFGDPGEPGDQEGPGEGSSGGLPRLPPFPPLPPPVLNPILRQRALPRRRPKPPPV